VCGQQINQEGGVGHLRNVQTVVPAYEKLFPQTWNAKTAGSDLKLGGFQND
jgi:hypothetical protein